MLHADKLAFEANLAQDLVAIQMKELDYLYKNLANLATSSAVLVGFGFSGVTAFASDDLTRRLTALGQPTSRRAPPKSKKNVKLDVEMGGANATL